MSYCPAIDGLRAVAVLAVVVYHFFPKALPAGFSGVDIFFVLSGYLLTARHRPEGYFQRRWRRIYPALITCLAVVSVLNVLFIPDAWVSRTIRWTGLAAFFGASNMVLGFFANDYFSPQAELNPFTHTWSLGIEEQFYLLLPLLLRLSLPLQWFITAASMGVALAFGGFYFLPARLWEFLAGSLAARFTNGRLSNAAFGLGLTAMAVGFVVPYRGFPVVGTVLVLQGLRSSGRKILESSVLVALGKRSYSLYLWHWPALVACRWTGTPLAVGIAAAALAAEISYRFIETPFLRTRRLSWSVAGVAFSVALVAYALQPWLSQSVTRDATVWSPFETRWTAPMAPVIHPRFRLFVIGDSHADAYAPMFRRLAVDENIDVQRFTRAGCDLLGVLHAPRLDCEIFFETALAAVQQQATPQDVVFLPALRVVRLSEQWETFAPTAVAREVAAMRARRPQALVEANRVLQRLARLGVRIVVDAPSPVFPSPPFRCADRYTAGSDVCTAGFSVSRAALEAHRAPGVEALNALAKDQRAMIVWDPFPLLCPGETCNAFEDAKPLFFDGDHLSAYGNGRVYESFRDVLKR